MTECPRGPYGVSCGVEGPHRVHQWATDDEPGASALAWVDWPAEEA